MANGDLIRKNELLRVLCANCRTAALGIRCATPCNAYTLTEKAFTVDAVEVVRCKDCKFSKPLENIPSHRYCIALKDVFNFGDDFYCARGAKMGK